MSLIRHLMILASMKINLLRPLLTLLACLLITATIAAQEAPPSPYDIALERIYEAQEKGSRELYLDRLGLDELPPEIGTIVSLRILRLEGNNLETLPSEINMLENLSSLDLGQNRLLSLPSEIGELEQL